MAFYVQRVGQHAPNYMSAALRADTISFIGIPKSLRFRAKDGSIRSEFLERCAKICDDLAHKI
jgi:hypothetical protein